MIDKARTDGLVPTVEAVKWKLGRMIPLQGLVSKEKLDYMCIAGLYRN